MSSDFGFSVRDIVAVGMADSHVSTKWAIHASPTTNIAKISAIQGGISVRLDGNPVDAFSYGQIFESRILRDPIPELSFSILLTDSTNKPLDNRTEGRLQIVEVGLKNPNAEKLVLQFWEARATGINYDFPDEQFATESYTYRGTDFRVTTAANAVVVTIP